MSKLETTSVKDGILANQVFIDANTKLFEEYLHHKRPFEPPFKPQKPEGPLKPFDFGTGDSVLENEYRQILEFKNGDHLSIQKNTGKITSFTDKNFNKIDIPGDGKNLAPADAPIEMYRLSNGALYTKDKITGDQTLVNDGATVVIDKEGILRFQRGDQSKVFARKQTTGLEYLEANPLPGGVLLK